MFNGGAFNRLPFNRMTVVSVVFLSAGLGGSGSMSATVNLDMTVSANLSGNGSMATDFVREVLYRAEMSGSGNLAPVQYIRERHYAVNLSGIGSMTGNISRYHIDEIEFVGDFKPGDVIIIDSNTLKMTLNRENALRWMRGDFFDLNLGNNQLTYTDDQGSRTVLMRVTHRDRFT